MTNSFKLMILAIVAVLFASCGAIHNSINLSSKVNLTTVHLGMSKAEVQTALNKTPDNIIASEHYNDTNETIEVVQYSRWISVGEGVNSTAKPAESYWLYFVNDKLNRWHQINPGERCPEDLRYAIR